MGQRNATDKKVTIQTTEGCYDATMSGGNTNNSPIQKQLTLTRYRIPKPPMMMRNIPMYRATNQLHTGQVLKFDIRNPNPGRKLWNRRLGNQEHFAQECIIETTDQIRAKATRATEHNSRKRTLEPETQNKKQRQ